MKEALIQERGELTMDHYFSYQDLLLIPTDTPTFTANTTKILIPF